MTIEFMGYKPLENDWKFWLVVNPATWLIPTLIAVAVTAILIHVVAFSLEGQGWHAKAAPAAVEAAAPAAQ
ncbi:light-harvesting protein [Caldichromatium japonicum]|uniref:Light-harvesting protein n=1 Tax=Caldichromatium japonicum TaxID=2699430 RepID=A0A6G7VFC1_9GAMM|nr:light-harvesting antenna LH1, alpha subunit [Caldichromatium japonicum]QIK38717.1 light-harvesting protein [Caldichromatium japonicum]QIK38721.1 light-harvesting protein [Caldichromatium japonicum]